MSDKHGKKECVESPGLTTSFLHPMGADIDSPVHSPYHSVSVYNGILFYF